MNQIDPIEVIKLAKGTKSSLKSKIIAAATIILLFAGVTWYYNKDNDLTIQISNANKAVWAQVLEMVLPDDSAVDSAK